MKVSGGPGYEQDWSFPEDEGKVFLGSRGSRATSTTTEANEFVSSSTESTVEDDDDYIAELTHYMLQDDDNHALRNNIPYERNEESWGCVGWPSITMWSPLGSSSGSQVALSEEASPPVTPRKVEQGDSENKSPPSYAAVLCNLDKLDTNKLGRCASRTTQVAKAENPKQGVAFDESQDSKLNLKLKQERNTKKQNGRQPNHITTHQTFLDQKKEGYVSSNRLRATPPIVNLPSTLWLNNHSNMRAVLLGGSGGGGSGTAPSSGTGVFLPCVIGNTSPSPKNKRGCAPVLIPAKVVQALKVHFDRVGDHLPRQNPTFPIQNDLSNKGGRKTSTSANRKRHSRSAAPSPDTNNNNDIGLPQEWTY